MLGPDELAVFLPCSPVEGTDFVLHGLPRPAPDGASVDSLVREAVEGLAVGPTPGEAEAGYWSSIPGGMEMVGKISVAGSEAQISFTRDFANQNNLSTSFVRKALVDSLLATVFQFEPIETLRLAVSGDCDRFWLAIGDAECRLLVLEDWMGVDRYLGYP